MVHKSFWRSIKWKGNDNEQMTQFSSTFHIQPTIFSNFPSTIHLTYSFEGWNMKKYYPNRIVTCLNMFRYNTHVTFQTLFNPFMFTIFECKLEKNWAILGITIQINLCYVINFYSIYITNIWKSNKKSEKDKCSFN